MLMLSPFAAASVANIEGGTLGFFEDKAIRRLLIAPGMPGNDGDGRCCNEPANKAAAVAAFTADIDEPLSPADEEEVTLKPFVEVLTPSRPFSDDAEDEVIADWVLLYSESDLPLKSTSCAELSFVLAAKKSFGLSVISIKKVKRSKQTIRDGISETITIENKQQQTKRLHCFAL